GITGSRETATQRDTHVWVNSRLHPGLRPTAAWLRPTGWLAHRDSPALNSVRRSVVSQNPTVPGQMVVPVVAVPRHLPTSSLTHQCNSKRPDELGRCT